MILINSREKRNNKNVFKIRMVLPVYCNNDKMQKLLTATNSTAVVATVAQ
jgi:hypothetical protein